MWHRAGGGTVSGEEVGRFGACAKDGLYGSCVDDVGQVIRYAVGDGAVGCARYGARGQHIPKRNAMMQHEHALLFIGCGNGFVEERSHHFPEAVLRMIVVKPCFTGLG